MSCDDLTPFIGLPWEAWTNSLGRSVPLGDETKMLENKPAVAQKLPKKDMKIFGLCPETDEFTVVICEKCNTAVKPQALAEHYERRHGNQDAKPVLLPIPEQLVVTEKMSPKAAKILSAKEKRKKVPGKEKEVAVNMVPKLEALTLENAALPPLKVKPLQTTAAVNASPAATVVTSKARTVPLKQRDYDPDKHCGVVSTETMKPCTWSLTCKSHAVSLRRAVPGRSKPFNQLLEDQRKAKEALVKRKKSLDSATSPATTVPRSPQPLIPLPSLDRMTSLHEISTNSTVRSSSSSLASTVPRNVNFNATSSPVVTPPPASTVSPDNKQNVSWNLNLVMGMSVSERLVCRLPELKLDVTPAKRIYLSCQPQDLVVKSSPQSLPLPVFVTETYHLDPPRPLSVPAPLFSGHKVGGLLYSNRRMQMIRQDMETCMYRARNSFSSLASCPRF